MRVPFALFCESRHPRTTEASAQITDPLPPLIGEEDLQRSRIEFIVTLVVTFSHENGITTDIQEITIGIGKAGNY